MSDSVRLRIEADGLEAREVALEELPASVGRRGSCTVRLDDRVVAPLAGHVRLGPTGDLEFQPRGGGSPTPLGPGSPLEVGPYTLRVLPGLRSHGGGALLEGLLELLPRLWDAEAREDRLRALLLALRGAFGAEWGGVFRVPEEGGEPTLLAADGQRDGGREGVSRTLLDAVLAGGRAVLAADVEEDPRLVEARSIPVGVRSVVGAPLAEGGSVRGLVVLESAGARPAFQEAERALLEKVCAFAAGHLDRVEQSERKARRGERLAEIHRVELAHSGAGKDLVGTSPAMRAVHEQVAQVTRTGSTTLILGESGTGKELVARAIHAASTRRDGPFVAVNCMALPSELVEDELFGHVKGAYSGASSDRLGRFELAEGGTLFLDELGELSLAMQVKLLRVLEERVVQRIGEAQERPVDVRLVAATNAVLEEAIEAGRFRKDLYFRLSVFVIRLPPLRERRDDLPVLVQHFVELFNRRFGRAVEGATPEALELLARHDWPGNIRELRNVVEAAFARETGAHLRPASLWLRPRGRSAAPRAAGPDELELARADFERAHILRILTEEQGAMPKAAARLGISRGNLYKKCSQYGLDPTKLRPSSEA